MSEKPIRIALLSVTDKTGLEEFAAALVGRGVRLIASSGTKAYLGERGIQAEDIASYTGASEMAGGRVKTLHPKVHASILADRYDPEDVKELDAEGIEPMDLVVVNLYPFQDKLRSGSLSEEELCELIDIGGVALARAAAKNYRFVTAVTSPGQYGTVMAEIAERGSTKLNTRKRLALEAFQLTASYDSAIERFFQGITEQESLPERLSLPLKKEKDLRYGENPHQSAALYRGSEDSYLLAVDKHQGKVLSFNNYLDIASAFSLARDLGEGSVAIVKHTNPCGAAWCGSLLSSYRRALACDRISAFGGIVSLNGLVDEEVATEMVQLFLEVVVARSLTKGAVDLFSKKKKLRVTTVPEKYWEASPAALTALYLEGALLCQETDSAFPELGKSEVVSKRQPTPSERSACEMAWKVAKHVKSNAVVIADGEGTLGIGAGQMSRVDSARISVSKAKGAGFSLSGTVAASDAFFPFPDGVRELAKSGIRAIIQPGGSIRDSDVIEAADEAGVTMIFTGRRHFRHL